MTSAVIATGGKQYLVRKGDVLRFEKLPEAVGKTVRFDRVLLLIDGATVRVGSPFLSGASVTAKVLEQGKGDKITVIKFQSKVRYRRKRGHRQLFTKVQIESIK